VNSLFNLDEILRGLVLSSPRIAAAFLILPMLSKEDAPPLVRNTIYVALAIAVVPFLGTAGASLPRDFAPWAGLVIKEALIGAMIGFAFAGVLWAVGMAGDLIDTKVGANMASIIDPLGGHNTSLSGAFLSRFANYLFLALGGLTIFLDVLLGSYQVWPVNSAWPQVNARGLAYFADSFGSMMSLAFMLSAPAMILMSMIDISLGVMNRYAPQLNVLPLTMALKAWLASGVLLLGLTAFIAVIVRSLDQSRGLLPLLRSLLT
jgi:type III secretion protein T